MDEQKRKELTKKYLSASSTLKEEELLMNDPHNTLGDWATFVRNEKSEVPMNLGKDVMQAIGKKTNSKRIFLFRAVSVAAAFALLLSFLFIPSRENEMTYEEKVEMLEQVLSGFSTETNVIADSDVIYEDELLIVYMNK